MRDDIQNLIRQAQQSLLRHPSNSTPGPDGTDAVKKILGGASTIESMEFLSDGDRRLIFEDTARSVFPRLTITLQG